MHIYINKIRNNLIPLKYKRRKTKFHIRINSKKVSFSIKYYKNQKSLV